MLQEARITVRRGDDRGTDFAAVELDLSRDADSSYLQTVVGRSKNTAARAWKWHDELGEVHYSVSRSARVASYATFHCDVVDSAGKIIRRVLEGEQRADAVDSIAAAIVRGIYSPWGGVRGLVDRWYGLMKVTADSYLIEVKEDGVQDGYMFLSADEIDGASADELAMNSPGRRQLRWLMMPQNSYGNQDPFGRDIAPEDFLGRVYIPSRRYIALPDVTLLSLEDECKILKRLTKTILGRLNQRFQMAGFWYLPSEIQEAIVVGVGTQSNQTRTDVLRYLKQAFSENIKNWDTAEVAQPIILRGPGQYAEMIKYITADQEIPKAEMELRQEMAERILFGMDVIKTAVTDSSQVSHWSGWQIANDEIRIAVIPDLEALCFALTRLVLHRRLLAAGVAPEVIMQYRVGFDLSAAAVRANQQEDARQTQDRGALKLEALRQASGFGEDDAPSEDEYIRWVGQQAKNPYLMTWGLPAHDEIDWTLAGVLKPGPAPDTPADEPESGPGEGDPGSPDDQDRDTPREDRPA